MALAMPRRKRLPYPIPRARDLFKEIPVTRQDIDEWCARHVPHLIHARWRIDIYVKGYNVADKIRAAKLNGSWFE